MSVLSQTRRKGINDMENDLINTLWLFKIIGSWVMYDIITM